MFEIALMFLASTEKSIIHFKVAKNAEIILNLYVWGNRAFESSIERQISRGKSQSYLVQQSVTKFSISNVVFGSHFDVSLNSYLNVKNPDPNARLSDAYWY